MAAVRCHTDLVCVCARARGHLRWFGTAGTPMVVSCAGVCWNVVQCYACSLGSLRLEPRGGVWDRGSLWHVWRTAYIYKIYICVSVCARACVCSRARLPSPAAP